MDTASGVFPQLEKKYVTLACQHCEYPACVNVCPVGATYKDEETGIVKQDYDKCIGCRFCMAACPYTNVRQFNWEEPEHSIGFAVGDAEISVHQKNVVEKCMLCGKCQMLCPRGINTRNVVLAIHRSIHPLSRT